MKAHYLNIFKSEKNIPKLDPLEKSVEAFSLTERTVFYLATILLILSSLWLLRSANNLILTTIPARGGSFTEGLIGAPRFLNPLLEVSEADRDLNTLLYSGLMRLNEDGELVPDLAETYTISEDGLTYTFTLRPDITFHDGTVITVDDVVFTIQRTQDPQLRSSKRAVWDSAFVKVTKVSDSVVEFSLKKAYAPFLSNTTLGILPKHIWSSATADEFQYSLYNTDPIGSGPYRVTAIERTKSGLPKSYTLSAFDDYALGEAYISKIQFIFFENEDDLIKAYEAGTIDSLRLLSPERAVEVAKVTNNLVTTLPSTRLFSVFYNQNHNKVLDQKEVREVLELLTDKQTIVEEVFSGYAQPAFGPIPARLIELNQLSAVTTTFDEALVLAKATSTLSKAGWKLNPESGMWQKALSKTETITLDFSLAAPNNSDMKRTAELLRTMWAKANINVHVELYEAADLQQNIIRPREYDALLFGQVVGRDLDLFAYWHSSQRNDPGYNITMYTNSRLDKLLDEARQLTDPGERQKRFIKITEELNTDRPALFLFTPDYIYLRSAKVENLKPNIMTKYEERFNGILSWYIESDHVWSFLPTTLFTKKFDLF